MVSNIRVFVNYVNFFLYVKIGLKNFFVCSFFGYRDLRSSNLNIDGVDNGGWWFFVGVDYYFYYYVLNNIIELIKNKWLCYMLRYFFKIFFNIKGWFYICNEMIKMLFIYIFLYYICR